MNEGHVESHRAPEARVQESHLTVKDLIEYLSSLANLHNHSRTGNLELSEGLRRLSKALQPYAGKTVHDLMDTLTEKRRVGDRESSRKKKPEATLPPHLNSSSWNTVEAVLSESRYTKRQLVELGVLRFGISQSKLIRLDRNNVVKSIRAALDHEMSLTAISKEARRGGANR